MSVKRAAASTMAFTIPVPPPPPPPRVKNIVCIGLGNIPYPNTKHSIGHKLVESIGVDLGFPKFVMQRPMEGLVTDGFIPHPTEAGEHVKVTLVKNRPLMNLCGLTMAKLLARFPLDPSTLYYLIYDHLDFQEGRVQIRLGGSHAGHKGVLSCQQILGGKKRDEVWQIRVGVGRPFHSADADARRGEIEARRENISGYVLSPISDLQLKACEPGGPTAARVWDDVKWAAFQYPVDLAKKVGTKKNPVVSNRASDSAMR